MQYKIFVSLHTTFNILNLPLFFPKFYKNALHCYQIGESYISWNIQMMNPLVSLSSNWHAIELMDVYDQAFSGTHIRIENSLRDVASASSVTSSMYSTAVKLVQ